MHLAMCERCFEHGRNCVFDFSACNMNKLISTMFNQFIHGTNYLCIFLDTIDQ
jgi:hypothetical protein